MEELGGDGDKTDADGNEVLVEEGCEVDCMMSMMNGVKVKLKQDEDEPNFGPNCPKHELVDHQSKTQCDNNQSTDYPGDSRGLGEEVDTEDGVKKSLKKGASAVTRGVKNLFVGCVSAEVEASMHMKDGKAPSALPASKQTSDQVRYIAAESEEDIYDFSHNKRGRAIIINNKQFCNSSGFKDRPGSEHDGKSLQELFNKLGFDVVTYKDLPAGRIVDVLKREAREYDHQNADCLAVTILSHGDSKVCAQTLSHLHQKQSQTNDNILVDLIHGVDGNTIDTASVLRIFQDDHCQGLVGKPRLFFFQACRGGDVDGGVDIRVVTDSTKTQSDVHDENDDRDKTENAADDNSETDETDAIGSVVRRKIITSPSPLFKDFMVMYATRPGHFAWRRTSGSWFIQSLHTVFTKDLNSDMSLTQALTRVIRMVAHGYQSQGDENMCGKKQTPVMYSMLIKEVYFTDKKKKKG